MTSSQHQNLGVNPKRDEDDMAETYLPFNHIKDYLTPNTCKAYQHHTSHCQTIGEHRLKTAKKPNPNQRTPESKELSHCWAVVNIKHYTALVIKPIVFKPSVGILWELTLTTWFRKQYWSRYSVMRLTMKKGRTRTTQTIVQHILQKIKS